MKKACCNFFFIFYFFFCLCGTKGRGGRGTVEVVRLAPLFNAYFNISADFGWMEIGVFGFAMGIHLLEFMRIDTTVCVCVGLWGVSFRNRVEI